MRILSLCLAIIALSTLPAAAARACTSILVAKGATADGSTLITYVADSHELYGELRYRPAAVHAPGAMRDIFDWDTGKYLGQIKEAPRTYAVVGNMNERQVAISETTFGGREELRDPTAVVDYGSLMDIALERAASAREAIKVMTELVAEYGYASEGESFSIADPNEAWILEMIGKGPGTTGAVWAARRLPDGMMSAHANQSRLRQLGPSDAASCLFAKDVVSFARAKGYFAGKEDEFSFADAYAPLDVEGLRFCEARVWNVFRRAAPSLGLSSDYVKGVEGAKPLPLWIKPDKKLAVADVMQLMRDHFEGTEFDMAKDVGAGPYHLPYRWRPLTWEASGHEYLNERAISTQQTGFSFVSQARSGLPDAIGGLLWFGVDDTFSTVYVPMYSGIRAAPKAYASGTANFATFSWESAFWVFNFVANFAYSRYDEMIVDIGKVQRDLEGRFLARQPEIEAAALKLYATSPEQARDYLTQYSASAAATTVERWRKLGEQLLVKYLDGNLRDEFGKVAHPGYPADWYEKIAASTGEKLKLVHLKSEKQKTKPVPSTGYFHSRDELGALASNVPQDFPFQSEKLVLLPGTDKCQRPPRCCVSPTVDATSGQIVVATPKEEPDKCGASAWLIRVPQSERRPLVRAE
jgi:dipeptidase